MGRPQSNHGEAFAPEDADAAGARDDADTQARGIAMMPTNPTQSTHRDAPSHADRPSRSSTAPNPRAPAPVATPQVSHDQPRQPGRPHLERQERQERQAQKQQERDAARTAGRSAAATKRTRDSGSHRRLRSRRDQVVQQPRTAAPAQQGEPNNRTMAQPQQRDHNGRRLAAIAAVAAFDERRGAGRRRHNARFDVAMSVAAAASR